MVGRDGRALRTRDGVSLARPWLFPPGYGVAEAEGGGAAAGPAEPEAEDVAVASAVGVGDAVEAAVAECVGLVVAGALEDGAGAGCCAQAVSRMVAVQM